MHARNLRQYRRLVRIPAGAGAERRGGPPRQCHAGTRPWQKIPPAQAEVADVGHASLPSPRWSALKRRILASPPARAARPTLGGCGLEAAGEQSIVSEACCARGEAVGGSAPVQLVHVREQPGVSPERRQLLEQHRQLAPLAEHTRWEVLDGTVTADEACRGRLTDPRQAWIPVCGVADQGEEVRDQMRRHAEFLAHTLCIAYDLGLAIHLNHPLATHALRQILVRCPDAYLLHLVVFGGDSGRGGERIVGFQLDHGPYRHSQRGERILERMKLREQRRLDPLTRLVARPKAITEGLDDVIGRHTEMRRPLLDHLQHGMQHAVYGAEGSIVAFVEAAQTIEVAEQLVRPVNQMNDHDISWPAAVDRQCNRCAAARGAMRPQSYSGSTAPEPPISFGKSFILGSPSLMRRTDS